MSDDASNENEKILESLFESDNAEILIELKDGQKSLSTLAKKINISEGKLDEKRKGDTKFKVGQFVRIKHHSVSFNDKFRITKFMRKNYLVEKVGEKGSFRVSPSLLIPFNKKT